MSHLRIKLWNCKLHSSTTILSDYFLTFFKIQALLIQACSLSEAVSIITNCRHVYYACYGLSTGNGHTCIIAIWKSCNLREHTRTIEPLAGKATPV